MTGSRWLDLCEFLAVMDDLDIAPPRSATLVEISPCGANEVPVCRSGGPLLSCCVYVEIFVGDKGVHPLVTTWAYDGLGDLDLCDGGTADVMLSGGFRTLVGESVSKLLGF